MNIQAITKADFQSHIVIYPLLKGENLTSKLELLANRHGLIADLLQQDFKAEEGVIILLHSHQKRVVLVGLGSKNTDSTTMKVFRKLFNTYQKTWTGEVLIDLSISDLESKVEAICNGACLGKYALDFFKTDKKETETFFTKADSQIKLLVHEGKKDQSSKAIEAGQYTAETQMSVMDLVNLPANHKYPETLADWAVQSGEKYGYETIVFDENQCKELGFGGLLGVGKGSEHPPRFIIVEYKHPEATRKVGLVGKGVTFDTGGISIKSSTNMHYMKSDMGGAAAVFGTVELAAKLQLPVHIVGIVPTTENSVDGLATKPGDVLTTYNGKTIEVIDTDAEGRIILADALAYMKRNFEPDVMIDLATLTGNCIAALGYHAAGLFTQNDDLAQALSNAGQQTGEKVWRLPMWEDYENELKSDVADVKNYHGKPFAGAIVAAKFLEVFTEKHTAWAHLDIAGTSFDDSSYASMKSSTAYGVRLLTHWLRS